MDKEVKKKLGYFGVPRRQITTILEGNLLHSTSIKSTSPEIILAKFKRILSSNMVGTLWELVNKNAGIFLFAIKTIRAVRVIVF